MHPLLFWIFAATMLIFGVSVIAQPNPVSSALSLVVSFIALAVLFVSLDAFFIGIIQVLVYAGAVMVLFLFIIMLLDLNTAQRRRIQPATAIGGVVIALLFVGQLVAVLGVFPEGNRPAPTLSGTVNDVQSVGHVLFSTYNLPFQIVAVLILVATVGVVVLSKRKLE